jgi:DNA-binding SARP family transcriptional activator
LNVPTYDCKLTLLGGFQLRTVSSWPLPPGAQRLLALLALNDDGAVDRSTATECLWPDASRGRAAANLRSALWRCKRVGTTTLIDCAGPRLCLAPQVRVDLQELLGHARRIVGTSGAPDEPAHREIITGLSRELLPSWSEDWLLPERERWDQVRLHALETLALQSLAAEDYLTALEVALAAIAVDSFRESAHRIVVKIHLAEGNSASAIKHYQWYRGLVQRELGVMPSRQMDELIESCTSVWTRPRTPLGKDRSVVGSPHCGRAWSA